MDSTSADHYDENGRTSADNLDRIATALERIGDLLADATTEQRLRAAIAFGPNRPDELAHRNNART